MKKNKQKYSKEIEQDVNKLEKEIKNSKMKAINNSAFLLAIPVIAHLLPVITAIQGIFIITIMLFNANGLKNAIYNINNYKKNIKSIKRDNEQKNLLLQQEIIKKEEELQPLAATLLENTEQLVENKDTQKLQLYSDALNIYEQLLYEYPQVSQENIEVEMDNQEVLKLTRKR